jgi:hypothetical protein
MVLVLSPHLNEKCADLVAMTSADLVAVTSASPKFGVPQYYSTRQGKLKQTWRQCAISSMFYKQTNKQTETRTHTHTHTHERPYVLQQDSRHS